MLPVLARQRLSVDVAGEREANLHGAIGVHVTPHANLNDAIDHMGER